MLLFAEAFFSRLRRVETRRALAMAGVASGALTVLLVVLSSDTEKTIGTLAMPAGLLWLVGLGVAAIQFARRDRAAAVTTAGLWLIYSMIGSAALGGALVHRLEHSVPAVDPFSSTYDAVIVLGGGTASRGEYDYLALSGDRVALGARLWHTGRTGTLVTTGSTNPKHPFQHNSATVTAKIWGELGIPAENIITLAEPTNTREELEAIAQLIEQHRWTHVGLVTSARHLPRALKNAERWNVDVVPLAADFRGASSLRGLGAFIPTGNGFHLVHTAVWEWLGRVSGR